MQASQGPEPTLVRAVAAQSARASFLLAVLLGLALPSWIPGDDPKARPKEDFAKAIPLAELRTTSSRALDRLLEIEFPREGKQRSAAEIIDLVDQIMQDHADVLVPVNGSQCLPARWRCHRLIAQLPAEGLRLYRERVDDQAKTWYERGRGERDAVLLQRLVDELFCSSYTDRALDYLGDLAFETGQYTAALRWWQLLATPVWIDSQRPPADVVNYPGPQVDLALVRAKQILAHWFADPQARRTEEIDAFVQLHAKAEGSLAGQKGNYATILKGLAEDRTLAGPAIARPWTTFAVDPSRNAVAAGAPTRLTLDRDVWPIRLGDPRKIDDPVNSAEVPSATLQARAMAFHPVFVDEHVLVANSRSIVAYHRKTGKATTWYDIGRDHHFAREDLKLLDAKTPLANDSRFTLTVANQRVYARLGYPSIALRPGDDGADGCGDSFIVCLQTSPNAKGERLRWVLPAQPKPTDKAAFEGSPIIHQNRLYVVVTRFHNAQAVSSLHCYAADVPDGQPGPPALRWKQDLCDVPFDNATDPRFRCHLLTSAGPNVVYCSHAGFVAAVNARTGKPAWSHRYPSRGQRTTNGATPRDLCPCIFADGRLFVAPADAERLFCLDPWTGRLLWESQAVEAVHLLGVAKNRLILTTGTKPRGIRALEASTGKSLRDWIHPATGADDLAPMGRGFLADDLVFWPSTIGLRVLKQDDGSVAVYPTILQHVRTGNMTLADGWLAVADATHLYVYRAEATELDEREQDAAARPDSAWAAYRLALAEADAGRVPSAISRFADAERLARESEPRVLDLARKERHRLLLQRAANAGQPRQAKDCLHQASRPEFTAAQRLQALSQLAELVGKEPKAAIAIWQGILDDPALSEATFIDRLGVPVRANLHAQKQITDLIQTHGRPIYAEVAARAAETLQRATTDAQRREAATTFPNSQVAQQYLRKAAEQSADRPDEAASLWRQLLRISGSKEDFRAEALIGLARAYEALHCWEPARATWLRLAQEHGQLKLAAIDKTRSLKEYVADRLQRSPLAKTAETPVGINAKFSRNWQSSSAETNLEAAFAAVVAGKSLVVGAGPQVVCWQLATGKEQWKTTVPMPIAWLGVYADILVAAGENRLIGLGVSDGQVQWQIALDPDEKTDRLADFQRQQRYLYFLQGQRRLLALDVENGEIAWQRWAPGAALHLAPPAGQFGPRFHVDDRHLVVQTGASTYWILDSRTGERLHEKPTGSGFWACSPFLIDERRLCVIHDAWNVSVVDPETGKEKTVWSEDKARPASLTGEPLHGLMKGGSLFLLTPRNYGFELERLHATTGVREWEQPLYLGQERLSLADFAFDDRACYFVQENAVQAHALADGRRLWKKDLGEAAKTRWRIDGQRGFLVLSPVEPWPVYDLEKLTQRFARSWTSFPPPPRVQRTAQALKEASAARRFAVLLCDRKDGQIVQRERFPALGSRSAVTVLPGQIVVVLQGQVFVFKES